MINPNPYQRYESASDATADFRQYLFESSRSLLRSKANTTYNTHGANFANINNNNSSSSSNNNNNNNNNGLQRSNSAPASIFAPPGMTLSLSFSFSFSLSLPFSLAHVVSHCKKHQNRLYSFSKRRAAQEEINLFICRPHSPNIALRRQWHPHWWHCVCCTLETD